MEIEEVPLWVLVEERFGEMGDFVGEVLMGHCDSGCHGVVGVMLVVYPQREDHLTWIGLDDWEDDG